MLPEQRPMALAKNFDLARTIRAWRSAAVREGRRTSWRLSRWLPAAYRSGAARNEYILTGTAVGGPERPRHARTAPAGLLVPVAPAVQVEPQHLAHARREAEAHVGHVQRAIAAEGHRGRQRQPGNDGP